MTIGAIDLPEVAASLQMGLKWDGDKQRALTLDELRAAAAGTPVDIQTALTPEEQQECTRLGWTFADYLTQKIRQKEEAEADRSNVAAAAQMSADEIAACAALGMSHDEFRKAKANDAAQLTSEERRICALTGLGEADYVAARAKLNDGTVVGAAFDQAQRSARTDLSEAERKVCKMMGMSHADFLDAKRSDKGR